jgi:archaellum biogenesis ATPase FlaH
MKGKCCRLYDENLVRNIMISTGLSIVEYIKQFKSVDAIDICDFVEQNADHIIENTIDDMNRENTDDPPDPEALDETEPGKDLLTG